MTFTWVLYLDLAKRLAGERDEASLRSAISRAYYAAFNEAKRYVRDQRRPEVVIHGDGRAHDEVWRALNGPTRPRQEKTAGIYGRRLKVLRGMADYELLASLHFPHDAQKAIEDAEALIRSLRQLKSDHA